MVPIEVLAETSLRVTEKLLCNPGGGSRDLGAWAAGRAGAPVVPPPRESRLPRWGQGRAGVSATQTPLRFHFSHHHPCPKAATWWRRPGGCA